MGEDPPVYMIMCAAAHGLVHDPVHAIHLFPDACTLASHDPILCMVRWSGSLSRAVTSSSTWFQTIAEQWSMTIWRELGFTILLILRDSISVISSMVHATTLASWIIW